MNLIDALIFQAKIRTFKSDSVDKKTIFILESNPSALVSQHQAVENLCYQGSST
jgi:hypothetical protein